MNNEIYLEDKIMITLDNGLTDLEIERLIILDRYFVSGQKFNGNKLGIWLFDKEVSEDIPIMRKCSNCHKWYGLDKIQNDTSKKFGKGNRCLVCNSEYSREWYNNPKNKEHRKEYEKQRRGNPENKEYMKEYMKEYNKQWYNNPKNKERVKEYKKEYWKQWYKDNGLKLKSKSIWNGTDQEYQLDDFLNKTGIVYFIADIHKQYVKIGVTTSIFSLSHRFRSIQGCNPTQLYLAGFIQTKHNRKLEKQLHDQFSKYHKVGEWFYYVPEISRYIETNCMKLELANTMFGETYLTMDEIF